MPNPVAHFEIYGDDPVKLAEFYQGLFGWKIDQVPGTEYWLIQTVPTDAQGQPNSPGGINGGLNVGINVLYSGTVAAAIEGAFFGITTSKGKEGKLIDVRVSTVPTAKGERIVMRLLDKEQVLYDLPELGFDRTQLAGMLLLLGLLTVLPGPPAFASSISTPAEAGLRAMRRTP